MSQTFNALKLPEQEEPECPRCGSTDWTITSFGNHGPLTYSYRLRCKRPTGRYDYKGAPVLCGACWPVRGEIKNTEYIEGCSPA